MVESLVQWYSVHLGAVPLPGMTHATSMHGALLSLLSPFDVGFVLLQSLELTLIKSLGKQEAPMESLISSRTAQSGFTKPQLEPAGTQDVYELMPFILQAHKAP